MPFEAFTEDKLEYRFYPTSGKFLAFKVKASNDAHLVLASGPSEEVPMYEIFIGGWGNSKTALRKNKEKPELATVETPNILTASEFKDFWVSWDRGSIVLGTTLDNPTPLFSWDEPSQFPINYFGIRTGWGATGTWLIDDNPRIMGSGRYTWVPTTGSSIPPNAVTGGFDNEQLYVGRACLEGSTTPGKVVPSHGVCYIPWGGTEHGISEYEVLCDCFAEWVPSSDGNVPPGAVPGGETEDGEVLYIGRATHEDAVTVGKIHCSHKVCYIPYGGREVSFRDYEVLVAK